MVLLALWAVVLALSPAVAEAQGIARTKDVQEGTESIVVRPGDSLWSISSERLGPNATPQQIASEVERIYALNRDQFGGDPNMIFAGQKLLAPPVVGDPSTDEPSAEATPGRETTQPAEASPTGRAAKGGTDQASRTPVGAADGKDRKDSDPVAEPATLPDAAAAAPDPAVRSLDARASPRSPVESFARTVRSAVSAAESAVVGVFPRDDYLGRKLLGLGVVLLSLIVGGLIAWKLPLRRGAGDYATWGTPRGYPNYRAHPEALDRYADASQASPTGLSRKGSAIGAYSPKIYRALSRAALETRPQSSANGRAKGTRREGGAPSARALLRQPKIVGNGHKPLELAVNEESRPYQRMHFLSARQREVLELVAGGLPNAQIAQRLFITESTVKQHLYKAYKTLGVRNRREAAKFLASNDQAERRPLTAGGVRL
jgi:DNA-binding CsgD family transcriptional regulator